MGNALAEAAYQTSPRVTLVDERQRIVRIMNMPEEVRRNPPAVLSHGFPEILGERVTHVEPVGRYSGHAGPRDADYRLSATRAGEDLLAHLRNELEPSVVVRRWRSGHADLLTTWES